MDEQVKEEIDALTDEELLNVYHEAPLGHEWFMDKVTYDYILGRLFPEGETEENWSKAAGGE